LQPYSLPSRQFHGKKYRKIAKFQILKKFILFGFDLKRIRRLPHSQTVKPIVSGLRQNGFERIYESAALPTELERRVEVK